MSIKISPQGYVYGEDPTAQNPFWDDDTPPASRPYVQRLEVTKEAQTDDAQKLTITWTNQDDEQHTQELTAATPASVESAIDEAIGGIQRVEQFTAGITQGTDSFTVNAAWKEYLREEELLNFEVMTRAGIQSMIDAGGGGGGGTLTYERFYPSTANPIKQGDLIRFNPNAFNIAPQSYNYNRIRIYDQTADKFGTLTIAGGYTYTFEPRSARQAIIFDGLTYGGILLRAALTSDVSGTINYDDGTSGTFNLNGALFGIFNINYSINTTSTVITQTTNNTDGTNEIQLKAANRGVTISGATENHYIYGLNPILFGVSAVQTTTTTAVIYRPTIS